MADKPAQPENQDPALRWGSELKFAKKTDDKWIERSRKIVKRYRDERDAIDSEDRRYNVLWSNVRTLMPAVYSRKPKAAVSRRNKDRSDVARTASAILERALQYELEFYNDFDSGMRNAILDRLLPGRGVCWVRYEPHFGVATQVTEDVETPAQEAAETQETLKYECTPVDYVYWEDFRMAPARTWEECGWVARRVYMGKEEIVERFGDDYADVPRSHVPLGLDEKTDPNADRMKKAKIWEIWSKTDGKVYWYAEGYPRCLDVKDDPLELDGFFPCPKPLYATTTTDQMVPVPDYIEYQDQARELDEVTTRIAYLVKACKVIGVYDASQTAIQRMFTEGADNTLIPVDTWAMFAEKGGIKGAIDWVPLDMVVQALNQLYLAREQIKQVIYEVTGISDILRGASQASETLGAQQIKAQFASMRLDDMKKDVARFASDIIRIKAQIMCSFYSDDSLIKMSGIQDTKDQPFIPQALAMLRNEPMRNFAIEVTADSLAEMDEISERDGRMQFLQAAGGFLREAVQAAQQVPEIAPLMGEMLMFAVRAWKTAEPLEASFEEAISKMSQPKPPAPPSPEAIKAQADAQKSQVDAQVAQVKAQSEQAKAQVEMQKSQAELAMTQMEMQRMQMEQQQAGALEQFKQQAAAQMEVMAMQHEKALEAARLSFDQWKAELDAATKIEVANISAAVKMNDTATAAATAEATQELKGND